MIFPPTLYKVQILAKNEDKVEIIRQLHKLATLHITQTKVQHGMNADTSLEGTNEISESLLQLRYIAEQTQTQPTITLQKLAEPQEAVTRAQELIQTHLPPLEKLKEQQDDLQSELERTRAQIQSLEKLPFNIKQHKDKETLVYYSSKQVKITMKHADITAKKAENGYYTRIILPTQYVEQLEEAVKDTPLKRINTSFITSNIEQTKQQLNQEASTLQEELTELNKQQRELLGTDVQELQTLITTLENHYDAYTVSNKFATTQELFVITGYCEKRDLQGLKDNLKDVVVHAKKAKSGAPTKLKNNKIAAYYEPLTELFSTPNYGAIDPTILVSIFFPLFYGLMFADIGYGLLTLALLPLIKNYTTEKWPIRILTISSLSTIFFGMMYGSFFGGLIPITPLYQDSFAATMPTLILSLIIGLVHMNLGVILSIVQGLKQPKKKLPVVLNALPFFSLQAAVASYYFGYTPIGHVLIAASIGLLIYNNGLFGIMDVSGYVGAVFSYARILALGLATAGVALAVNTIADKVATLAGIGAVLWLLITVIGHLFNFVVSIIGVSINSARLHYVEFFSLFFEGGGDLFEPFKRKNYMEVQ